MSFPFGVRRKNKRTIDSEGRRIIGLTLDTSEPIWAPHGSGLLESAIGGGKTTCGAVPWILSLASDTDAAQLVTDSKDGEISAQLCAMLESMGRKVAVIDDMGARPELKRWRISLNPFGAAVRLIYMTREMC